MIILNYSNLAHNTLHLHHGGWTIPIMQCRGLVLDFADHIRSMAFQKFGGKTMGLTLGFPKGHWKSP